MGQMKQRFGLSVALATPFDNKGRIDTERAVAHAQWCLSNGCGSVTLFGTTGEGASIGSEERDALLSAFLAGSIEASQIVVGVMANSIADAAAQIMHALRAGCKGILLAPPSYFKGVSDDGLFAWFSEVFKAAGHSSRDVYLYNIPSVTAVELSVALVGRLKTSFPGIVAGVKDSSGNWPFTQELLAAHGDLAILIGDERCLAAGVRLGGQGAISGMANVCPERMLSMVQDGRDDNGLTGLVDRLVTFPVTPGVKAMVAHRTKDQGWLATRPPLRPLSESDAKQLASFLDQMEQSAAA
jgi:4-hydroxy-tetrahydrodipicolinate synthase